MRALKTEHLRVFWRTHLQSSRRLRLSILQADAREPTRTLLSDAIGSHGGELSYSLRETSLSQRPGFTLGFGPVPIRREQIAGKGGFCGINDAAAIHKLSDDVIFTSILASGVFNSLRCP